MKKINKILVANRGEIALRVMRSAKEAGIKTVAVFSEADRAMPHVKYADEAVCIGKSQSADSYLRGDKIIEVCKKLNVDAIHPGYGFLSENADFAEKVNAAGIIFIGPDPYAIRIMGNKLKAKAAVKQYNIPMIPGTDSPVSSIDEAKKIASEIAYPILIKAAAGGGGKGIRVVTKEEDFDEQITLAINEAKSAFGDGSVFMERYVTSPRHIEIQILADTHGNTLYLFERECSIQRRHQKVIEEAPSAVLTPELRKQMGESAVKVAKACNYKGAGTVEFLLDQNMNYYFLEMNTRLQVEHPVTELITRTDLVKEQIRIAEGKAISFKQEDLKITGHAIELRVYAEDPENNFLPDTGYLRTYIKPEGVGIRIDDGFDQGIDIPIYYDPMISKLSVHGRDRDTAIKRMSRAIEDYKICGVKTTLPFGAFVMRHQAFVSGDYDTNFVNKYYLNREKDYPQEDFTEIAAIIAVHTLMSQKSLTEKKPENNTGEKSNWKRNRH